MKAVSYPRITVFLLLSILLAACQEEDVLRNPEIEHWCGNRPCFWEVTGKVERVGTWHSNDYAAALLSDHAELSQEVDYPGIDDYHSCFHISMLLKMDEGVRADLEVDFLPEAGVDWSKPLPHGDFDPVGYEISPPTWYERARFVLRKDGPGRAVIAKLRVIADDECYGVDPIELNDRPESAACEEDSQCRSGHCDYDETCAYLPTDGGVGDACANDAGQSLCGCQTDDAGNCL